MNRGPDISRWDLLSAYVDGELDDATMAAVARSLRTDREMADGLTALRRQERALRDWAEAAIDRPVPAGVRALLRRGRAGIEGVSVGTAFPLRRAGGDRDRAARPAP